MSNLTNMKEYNKYNMYSHINGSKSRIIYVASGSGRAAKTYIAITEKPPADHYVVSLYDKHSGVLGLTDAAGQCYLVQVVEYDDYKCRFGENMGIQNAPKCGGKGYLMSSTAGRNELTMITNYSKHECPQCLGQGYNVSTVPITLSAMTDARLLNKWVAKLEFAKNIYIYSLDASDWSPLRDEKPPKKRGRKSSLELANLDRE